MMCSFHTLPPALPGCSGRSKPGLSQSRDLKGDRRTMERLTTRGEEALEIFGRCMFVFPSVCVYSRLGMLSLIRKKNSVIRNSTLITATSLVGLAAAIALQVVNPERHPMKRLVAPSAAVEPSRHQQAFPRYQTTRRNDCQPHHEHLRDPQLQAEPVTSAL